MLFFTLLGSAPFVLLIGVYGSVRYLHYWEFLVAGFLFELLYGVGTWSSAFPFPMFLGSTILLILIRLLRTRLR